MTWAWLVLLQLVAQRPLAPALPEAHRGCASIAHREAVLGASLSFWSLFGSCLTSPGFCKRGSCPLSAWMEQQPGKQCLMQKMQFSLPASVILLGSGEMALTWWWMHLTNTHQIHWNSPLFFFFLLSYSVWICNLVCCILPTGASVCFVEQHHWNPFRCKKICYRAEETGSSQSKGYR